jgi:prepilin-type N-terminal cleavage/methylation domain-containing protein/prepilin-type processing-associated H-X9-DG protein
MYKKIAIELSALSNVKRHSPKRGFTLIELLVVISIIAILMAILMPALSKVRENARRTICSTRLRDIGTALSVYRQMYDGHLPPSWAIGTERGQYSNPDPAYRWHMRIKDVYFQQRGDSYSFNLFRCPNMEKYTRESDSGGTAHGMYGYNFFFVGNPSEGFEDTHWWKKADFIRQPSELPLMADLSNDKVANLFPDANSGWWMSVMNPHPSAYKYGWLGGRIEQYGESRSNMFGPSPNHGNSGCNFLMADGHTATIDITTAGSWPWLGDTEQEQTSGRAFHPARSPSGTLR